ncbi:MAG: tRNA 2-selenouridine(34) synthase MnmH [Cyclonatronaceae bacterium]
MTRSLPIKKFLTQIVHRPVFDVRTPAEFTQGHLPGAINLPLFSNDERAVIGTIYKQQGREKAVRAGLKFAGPKLPELVDKADKEGSKQVLMYCWRGGLRSGSLAWLLGTAGFDVSVLDGGYKSFRNLLKTIFSEFHFIVISGNTGSGKTDLLHEIRRRGAQVLDLEALACHKGSAFGSIGEAKQPVTEQFQNDILIEMISFDTGKPVFIEDESLSIGRVVMPDELFAAKSAAPFIEVQTSREERIARLLHIYGNADHNRLAEGILRVEKKLGGLNTKKALEALEKGDLAEVASLLLTYYDKAYQKAITNKKREALFRIPFTFDRTRLTAQEIIQRVHIYHHNRTAQEFS